MPPFVSAFTLLVAVSAADGGYFRDTWVWATLALTCLASINLVLRDTIVLGRLEVVGIAGLTAFVGWAALSAVWSPTPQESLRDAERGLVYAVAFLASVLALDRKWLRHWFRGIAGAVLLVMTWVMVARLLGSPERDPTQGTLLIEPFGYANAAGIFTALGILVSLGLALLAKSRKEQIAWTVGVAVLMAVLVQTESRGAWLALGIGLVVLALLMRPSAPLAVGAVGILAVALPLTIGIALAGADRPFGDRIAYWDVALDQWQENPWVGSGAGTFPLYWLRGESTSAVLDGHSLYLEALAELGLVGLVLLVAAFSTPIVGAVRARGDPLLVLGAPAYAAFLVHAGLDWDWEMPAVTLAGLLCGTGVLATGRGGANDIAIGVRARAVCLMFALGVAGLAVGAAVT